MRDQWDGRRLKDLEDRIAEGVEETSNEGKGVMEWVLVKFWRWS